MFCQRAALATESDVEQKLIWPLLQERSPGGLGFEPVDVRTKASLIRLEIDKGDHRRLYYPDYVAILAGLPVLVIEAKKPGESIDEALREARLYAGELNALHATGVNPCTRVIACNGEVLASSPVDIAKPDIVVPFANITLADPEFARLVASCQRSTLQRQVDDILRRNSKGRSWTRPLQLVGGKAVQAEELPVNTFGATIAGDYGHIFNPTTVEDRSLIAREAYINSAARERYVEPIDRVIRGGISGAASKLSPIDNSESPIEVTKQLRERKSLENQVLLLVGSVGSGKTTFIDRLVEIALPRDLVRKTVWARLNLNDAPLLEKMAYDWVTSSLIEQFRAIFSDVDFDEHETLQKVFNSELNALRKGPLKILGTESSEYKSRIVDRLTQLQSDRLAMARAIGRWKCGDAGKLLVVVLDNCDKRNRDEQLLMFQVAQWIRTEFRCLVVVPIRDTTFDLYKNEPPLDTVLPNLQYRIEPPPFVDVLQARVSLALKEMNAGAARGDTLEFIVPNGMRVRYPVSDQGFYLASVLRSLFAHDRFVRQVMSGLAGRDVRRALGMFLDFCTSGHIGADEIYKIRVLEGQYELPLRIVARVLLRTRRRYYNGDDSNVKNLFQVDPGDAYPDHFVRPSILSWLQSRLRLRGPSGVAGFFRTSDLISDVAARGHDAARVRTELLYLLKSSCIVAEHLRTEGLEDGDLVKITSAGVVHLQLLVNPDYIAACAEDAYVSDLDFANGVAKRVGFNGSDGQFLPMNVAEITEAFGKYLSKMQDERVSRTGKYLAVGEGGERPFDVMAEVNSASLAAMSDIGRRFFVGNLPHDASVEGLRQVFERVGVHLSDAWIKPAAGFGFVTFTESHHAFRAASLSVNYGTRALRLSEAVETPAERKSKPREAQKDRAVQRSAAGAGAAAAGVTSVGKPTPGSASDVVRAAVRLDRICIRNLPFSLGQGEVASLVRKAGLAFVSIELVERSGHSRGIAFATMASDSDAQAAIALLDGVEVGGRSIRVSMAAPRNRKANASSRQRT